jgi:hypothetical protein
MGSCLIQYFEGKISDNGLNFNIFEIDFYYFVSTSNNLKNLMR